MTKPRASHSLSSDAVSLFRPVAMSLAVFFAAGVLFNMYKGSQKLFWTASIPEAANMESRIVLPNHGDFEYDPVERFDFNGNRPVAFAVVGGVIVVFAALLSA